MNTKDTKRKNNKDLKKQDGIIRDNGIFNDRAGFKRGIIALIFLIVSIFLIFLYSNYSNRQKNIDRITLVISEISQNTASHIQDVFSDHLSSIKVSASLYGTSLKSAEADLDLLRTLENTTSFDYIRFIRPDGIDYASDGAIANCYDREYFQDGMEGDSGMCEVLASRISGEKLIGFYCPVYYEKAICGVMVGFLKEQTITSILRNEVFGDISPSFLIRDDGVVVGQSIPEDFDAVSDITAGVNRCSEEEYEKARIAFENRQPSEFVLTGSNGRETVGFISPVDFSNLMVVQIFPENAAVSMTGDTLGDSNGPVFIMIIVFLIVLAYLVYTYQKVARSYMQSEVNKEKERNRIQIDLIVTAIRTVYPFIMTQNLSEDRVNVAYSDDERGLATLGRDEDGGVSVDELVRQVSNTVPNVEDKRLMMNLFSREALLKAYEEGRFTRTACVRQTYPDGEHWIEINVIIVKGLDDKIYSVSMTRMVDDEIKRNEELIEAKEMADAANRSKSQFLANMSHEIRTPINAILGMNTMVLRESSNPAVKSYALNVQEAGKILLSLINDILDFSKIESDKIVIVPTDYELSSLINDLVNMIRPKAEEKDLLFNLVVDEKLPEYLYGDETRIKQIILNILTNAVKYTQKGEITFTVSCKKDNGDSVDIFVSVKDTGMGIRQENIEHLFEAYERLEESAVKTIEGTGLGMTIVKSLLKRMGSEIYVESEFGVGSEFYFTIKQLVKKSDRIGNFTERIRNITDGMNEDDEEFHAPNARILVVDDVEMNLLVVVNLLKRIQIKIDTVSSGQDAISMADKNHYDLILLDAMMPKMSGNETMRHIRRFCELNRKCPIVVMTANAVSGAKEEYLTEGFDDYLSKPVSSKMLEECLKKYLPKELIIPVVINNTGESSVKSSANDSIKDSVKVLKEASKPRDEEDVIIDKLGTIEDIDIDEAVKASGSSKSFVQLARLFYESADERMKMIENYYIRGDLENYTIQVHALKSSARLVGAMELSELARSLEMAAKSEDTRVISDMTGKLLTDYQYLVDRLSKAYELDDANKVMIEEAKLKRMLAELREVVEGYDYDTAQMIMEAFEEYKLPGDFIATYKIIKSRLADVDGSAVMVTIDKYLSRN